TVSTTAIDDDETVKPMPGEPDQTLRQHEWRLTREVRACGFHRGQSIHCSQTGRFSPFFHRHTRNHCGNGEVLIVMSTPYQGPCKTPVLGPSVVRLPPSP